MAKYSDRMHSMHLHTRINAIWYFSLAFGRIRVKERRDNNNNNKKRNYSQIE